MMFSVRRTRMGSRCACKTEQFRMYGATSSSMAAIQCNRTELLVTTNLLSAPYVCGPCKSCAFREAWNCSSLRWSCRGMNLISPFDITIRFKQIRLRSHATLTPWRSRWDSDDFTAAEKSWVIECYLGCEIIIEGQIITTGFYLSWLGFSICELPIRETKSTLLELQRRQRALASFLITLSLQTSATNVWQYCYSDNEKLVYV